MDFDFIKLRVGPADLLLLEGIGDGSGGDRAAVARSILHRRRGVGALRLVSLARSEKDIWLEVYDRDGSREAAVFDAALCAARWLLDSGRAGSGDLRFRTRWGEIQVDVLDGSSLGISVGALYGLPDRSILDVELALERRLRVESRGEGFEALPVALAAAGGGARQAEIAHNAQWSSRSGSAGQVAQGGPEGVVFFHEGGAAPLRVRLSSRQRGKVPAVAVPALCLSDSEIRIGGARDARLDTVSMAAMALGAAALLGRASDEAFVGSGEAELLARRNPEGSLYVAARPAYVFRGEFHIDEEGGVD